MLWVAFDVDGKDGDRFDELLEVLLVVFVDGVVWADPLTALLVLEFVVPQPATTAVTTAARAIESTRPCLTRGVGFDPFVGNVVALLDGFILLSISFCSLVVQYDALDYWAIEAWCVWCIEDRMAKHNNPTSSIRDACIQLRRGVE